MANQKGDTVSTGHFWNRCIDAVNKKFETYSIWSKASDTEFDDGGNAETKVGAIKGITSDLNTTTTGYAADMTTVAKLNSSLESQPQYVYDGTTGQITGYKTKIGGADTVFPFSNSINKVIFRVVVMPSAYENHTRVFYYADFYKDEEKIDSVEICNNHVMNGYSKAQVIKTWNLSK